MNQKDQEVLASFCFENRKGGLLSCLAYLPHFSRNSSNRMNDQLGVPTFIRK